MFSLVVLYMLSWVTQSPQDAPPAKTTIRSCPDSWNDTSHGKKASSGKKKSAPRRSGACIELAVSPLDVQEHLQSYSRHENWGITDDQLTQDSWTFSLELTKEELLRDTVAESNPKRVQWTSGSVRVLITTFQLPDGFARTTVRAMFRGYGKADDQFAPQKEFWDLESSNAFEAGIVSELRRRFANL